MINLLPAIYKSRLRKEARFRLFVLLGVVLGCFVCALVLLLLAMRIYGEQLIVTARAERTLLEEAFVKENSVIQEIQAHNRELGRIKKFWDGQASVVRVFDALAVSLPSELSLISASYTPRSVQAKQGKIIDIPARIAVTGHAPTRDGLFLFKEALQKNAVFSGVNFPPSNWAYPADILFSFAAEITP